MWVQFKRSELAGCECVLSICVALLWWCIQHVCKFNLRIKNIIKLNICDDDDLFSIFGTLICMIIINVVCYGFSLDYEWNVATFFPLWKSVEYYTAWIRLDVSQDLEKKKFK